MIFRRTIGYSKHHRTIVKVPSTIMLQHFNGAVFFNTLDVKRTTDKYLSNIETRVGVFYNTESNILNVEGKFVTREFGDGLDDHLLRSVIFEGIPTRDWIVASYATNPDPIFKVELRNAAWAEPATVNSRYGYTFDIVANTMAAQQGKTPWHSFAQTPTDPDYDAGLRITFNPDEHDNFPTENAVIPMVWRESLLLNAPLNSRFRRMRFRFRSVLTHVIRSIRVNTSFAQRRSG